MLLAQAKKTDEDEEGVKSAFYDSDWDGGNKLFRKTMCKVGVFLIVVLVPVSPINSGIPELAPDPELLELLSQISSVFLGFALENSSLLVNIEVFRDFKCK